LCHDWLVIGCLTFRTNISYISKVHVYVCFALLSSIFGFPLSTALCVWALRTFISTQLFRVRITEVGNPKWVSGELHLKIIW
jgi:hypothetical protein